MGKKEIASVECTRHSPLHRPVVLLRPKHDVVQLLPACRGQTLQHPHKKTDAFRVSDRPQPDRFHLLHVKIEICSSSRVLRLDGDDLNDVGRSLRKRSRFARPRAYPLDSSVGTITMTARTCLGRCRRLLAALATAPTMAETPARAHEGSTETVSRAVGKGNSTQE